MNLSIYDAMMVNSLDNDANFYETDNNNIEINSFFFWNNQNIGGKMQTTTDWREWEKKTTTSSTWCNTQ